MEILGHSQIGVTMNVYTHVVQDTQREAMATWIGCSSTASVDVNY